MKTFKLCYIEGNRAYFTTQEVTDQWGDDWDDTPYEHNAETPYEFREDVHGVRDNSTEPWEISKVYFEGPFCTPADNSYSGYSEFSVKQINEGQTPWLSPDRWATPKHKVFIWAGETIDEFMNKMISVGGKIYVDKETFK